MPQTDHLKTDCSKCAALCCLVLAFDKGKDFAFDKNPCEPCRNLEGHKCAIHDTLQEDGFAGCVSYDCLGAGNRVVQEIFDGQSWQQDPRLIRVMMEAFSDMREVHKRIRFLRDAEALPLDPENEQIRRDLLNRLEQPRWTVPQLTEFTTDMALEVDIFSHQIKAYLPASFSPDA